MAPITLRLVSFFVLASLLLSGCQPIQPEPLATDAPPAAEVSPPVSSDTIPTVYPVLETPAVVDMEVTPEIRRTGDADDPAIWLHPVDSALSLVITALKEGGFEVYDLDGLVVQSEQPEGVRYNNVDLIYDFLLSGELVDLAVFSDRFMDNLAIYRIDPEIRNLENVTDPSNALIFTPEGSESDQTTTAYGLATYMDPASSRAFAFVSRRETGTVAQIELTDNGSGLVKYETVRSFDLPVPEGGELADAQTEGMVVDPSLGVLYIGQEGVGLWRTGASPDSTDAPVLIDAVGQRIQPDVEGLTLYFGPDSEGYLIVSSQGDDTFHVYTRSDNTYIGRFSVASTDAIDGANESDGAHVLNVVLGARFPQGLLVVQDGQDEPEVMVEDDGEMENAATSFKFVAWQDVASAFEPPLMIDTSGYVPRGRVQE